MNKRPLISIEYAMDVHREFSSSAVQRRTVLFLLVAWVLFSVTTGGEFLSSRNLSNLFRQATVLGIVAVGLQFVVVSGNIDLTIGVLTGFCSIFTSGLQTVMLPVMPGPVATILSIIFVLGFCVLFGTVQGALVGRLALPAIIVSLGLSQILMAITPLATLGVFASGVDISLLVLGQGYLQSTAGTVLLAVAVLVYGLILRRNRRQRRLYNLAPDSRLRIAFKLGLFAGVVLLFKFHVADGYRGLPVPVLLLALLTLFFTHLLAGTRFGVRTQAIGFSRSVARFSGVHVERHIIGSYVISAAAGGLAGIVLTGYTSFGVFGNAMGLSFSGLAACLIGLVGFRADRLAVAGAVFGALVLASIDNWMVLGDFRPWLQEIIRGFILLMIAFIAVRSSSGLKLFFDVGKTSWE